MARYAWGIDIGDGTLKAVRLVRTRTGYAVVGAEEIPYFDPFFAKKRPPTPIDRRAVAALIQFANSQPIADSDSVAIGFESYGTFEGHVKAPRTSESDLDRIVSFEVAEESSVPLDNLTIAFEVRDSRSPDTYKIQTLATVTNEVETFGKHLDETGLTWDRIYPAGGALVHYLRLSHPASGDYAVLSPGLAATSLLVAQRSDYRSKTIPAGLPLPPGEGSEMAPDKMSAFADRLKKEIDQFIVEVFGGGSFAPKTLLISGEGARVPALLNALDARMGVPVEILGGGPRLTIDSQKAELPPADVVSSMGRALGLALEALSEKPVQLALKKADQKRQVMRIMPALTGVTLLLLLCAVGFRVAEMYRNRTLTRLSDRHEVAVPRELSDEVSRLDSDMRLLERELNLLGQAREDSLVAALPGRIISRFEEQSQRGVYGDYHLVEISFSCEEPEARKFDAVVGTRLSDERTVSREMFSLFGEIVESPMVTGPHPSGEVNPPENMSPLVHYRVNGILKGGR